VLRPHAIGKAGHKVKIIIINIDMIDRRAQVKGIDSLYAETMT
jgi:hypothetical protein